MTKRTCSLLCVVGLSTALWLLGCEKQEPDKGTSPPPPIYVPPTPSQTRPPTETQAQFTESNWQVAFNNKVTHGKLEVVVVTGRIDILTDTHAIEVDHARNYRAATKQALQYAAETKKKPGVALIIDGARDTMEAVQAAKKHCEEAGASFWLINEYVSVNDLVSQKAGVPPTPPATPASRTDTATTAPPPEQDVEHNYWLSSSGVRHNRSCRWFGNTKNGRYCGPNEGRPCKQCGG